MTTTTTTTTTTVAAKGGGVLLSSSSPASLAGAPPLDLAGPQQRLHVYRFHSATLNAAEVGSSIVFFCPLFCDGFFFLYLVVFFFTFCNGFFFLLDGLAPYIGWVCFLLDGFDVYI